MSTAQGGGLRKRRTDTFVQVGSKTVTDASISYRALGVLVYLLDRPDGWDVSAETLMKGPSRPDREGREATRTALRELAVAGYYRLERRRLRSGKFAMGTAISETPVASWSGQARFFDNKPIPMVEQADGTFLVKYPDGTLQPDDFPPPQSPEEAVPGAEEPGQTGAQETVPGTGDGFPGPGLPTSGEAAPGSTSPKTDSSTQRGYTETDSPTDYPREIEVQPALDGTEPPPKPEREPTTNDRAYGIARGWMAYRAKQNAPVAGKRAEVILRGLTMPFLDAGYTDDEVKHAFTELGEGIPSKAQLDRALTRRRTGAPSIPNARRGHPAPTDLRVNDHWDKVRAKELAASAAGGES